MGIRKKKIFLIICLAVITAVVVIGWGYFLGFNAYLVIGVLPFAGFIFARIFVVSLDKLKELERIKLSLEERCGNLEKRMEERTAALEKSNKELVEFSSSLEEKIIERTYELSMLYEVSNAISYTLDSRELLRLIIETLLKLVDYDICGAILFDSSSAEIILKSAHSGVSILEEEAKNNLIDRVSSLSQEDIRCKKINTNIILPGIDVKSAGLKKNEKLSSRFDAPFIVRGKTAGMISVFSCQEDAFDEDSIRLVYTMANQVSSAIERLQAVISTEKTKMEAMVQSMAEGIAMVDERGEIVVLNPSARWMLGFTPEEGVTNQLLDERMEQIGLAGIIKDSQKAEKLVSKEIVIPSERKLILHIDATPVKDIKNTAIGTVIIFKDITKEKEIEAMKNEFVSMVSHELRAPLTIIGEGINIILDRVTGQINNEQEKILNMAKSNIERLSRIINSLLDIAKIEAGKVELKKNIFDITGIAEQVVSDFKGRAQEKGIKLRTSFSNKEIYIYADKDKIIQVFINLVSNALKFTKEGFIEVSVLDKSETIECAVVDTGKGISAENLAKVFSKFQQFGHSERGESKGTGLGLSISKGIVEMHQGRIWIESEFGKGSKFVFTIPRKSEIEYLKETLQAKVGQVLDSENYCVLLIMEVLNLCGPQQILCQNNFMRLFSKIKERSFKAIQRSEEVILPIGDNKIAVIFTVKNREDVYSSIDKLKMVFPKKLFLGKDIEAKIEILLSMSVYGGEINSVEKMLENAGKTHKKFTLSIVGKREIVVVDDEENVLKTIAAMLDKTGEFRVYTYSSAIEAVSEIVRIEPDIIMTDINMPAMNGYELIGRLREYEECEQIPIIFMTGYVFDEDELKSVKTGKIAKLNKPFTAQDVIEKIESLLKPGYFT